MNLEEAREVANRLADTTAVVDNIVYMLDTQGFLEKQELQKIDVMEGELTRIIFEGLS